MTKAVLNLQRLNKALALSVPMQAQIQKLTDVFVVDSDAALQVACERQYTHLFFDEAYLHQHMLKALDEVTKLQTTIAAQQTTITNLQQELEQERQPKPGFFTKLLSNFRRS